MAAIFSARAGDFMDAMKLFVPWSEELAEKHPDLVTRLVPYRPGMRCAHQAGTGEDPAARPEHQPEEGLPREDAA